MKKTILAIAMATTLSLSGCAGLDTRGTSEYLLATATIASTFEITKKRHDRLVGPLTASKDKFSDEEKEILKVQLGRIQGVASRVEALQGSGQSAAKILAATGVFDDYAELRDAYSIALDIVVSHVDDFPVILKYDILAQERDAKRLDAAITVLLARPDGTNYSEGLSSILALARSAAQIAIAVG